jgi:hypothetical protein
VRCENFGFNSFALSSRCLILFSGRGIESDEFNSLAKIDEGNATNTIAAKTVLITPV